MLPCHATAMPESDPNLLHIRCPRCGQRFKVSPDLRDKMVECGACENRFRVTDEVTLRTKKFYPGETRRGAHLERFSRAPLNPGGPVTFATVEYSPDVSADVFEPPAFQRVIAGLFGVGMMLLTGLAFILSAGGGGPLGAISHERRIVLALFVAVIGGGFIVYANKRARGKAALAALGLAALLVALAFIFPGPEQGAVAGEPAAAGAGGGEPAAGAAAAAGGGEAVKPNDPSAAIKEEIRYGPVEQEIAAAGGNAERVTAVWLRGMSEGNKYSVQEFLLRVSGADRSSHIYPRGEREFLLVLTGVEQEIEATAQACRRIGKIEKLIRPLRVIEVRVDSDRFAEVPLERLGDPASDAFYALNLKELESIDLRRVERAVDRLSAAKPVQFRRDVVRQMIELLKESPAGLLGKLGRALERWSEPDEGAEPAVLAVAQRLHAAGSDVDEGLIAFLVARKVDGVQPIIHEAWLANPDNWEPLYITLGQAAEQPMLEALRSKRVGARESAVRILGQVASPATIPALEAFGDTKDRELQVLVTRAIEQIRNRAGARTAPGGSSG